MSNHEIRKALEDKEIMNEIKSIMEGRHKEMSKNIINIEDAKKGKNNVTIEEFDPIERKEVEDKPKAKEEAKKEPKKDNRNWYVYSEKGNKSFLPKALANNIIKDIELLYVNHDYYVYKNGVYKKTDEEKIRNYIIEKYLDIDVKRAQVEETKYMLQPLINKHIEEINTNENIINCKNCMLVIENNSLRKISHDPKILVTTQINAELKKDAECIKFNEFLKDIFIDDDILTVQEMFGYCLTASMKAQVFFLLTGEAGCGKSIVLNIIQHMLGDENVSNVRLQDLADRFKTASLIGKSANIFADIDEKTPLDDSSILKALTGEDTITVEKKGKDPQQFKNKAKCLFSCNGKPRIIDTSNAVYRRLIMLQCKEPKPESERKANLYDELIVEIDGIFKWALVGLQRLISNDYKFTQSEQSINIKKEYKARNNNVMAFVDDNCIIGNNETYIECQKLYDIYKKYCDENGFKALSSKSLTIELEKNYKNIKKDRKRLENNKRPYIYIGIDLNPFE